MSPERVPERASRLLLGTGLAAVLLLSACAGPAGTAPGGSVPDADAPTATAPPVPAASGPVTVTATVLQDGDGPPELCLGGVAESLPPQCGGPEITPWDWDAVEADSASGTTWGDYTVVGTWDGETFHVTEVTTAPAEEPVAIDDPRLDPDNAGALGPDATESDAQDLHEEVFDHLDGLGGWFENGYVWVTVVYDDGSIQRYADEKYGADTVVVLSALRHID